jgi:hypothetical protein
MKEIQPIIFPLNLGTATFLNCIGNDNFSTNVTITYQLLTFDYVQLKGSILIMDGADYESYNTSNNGNQFIYDWSAAQLGVTLI